MMQRRSHPTRFRRRGSVVLIVMWTIAVAAIIVSSLQLFGHRQALLGREATHRAQARWAARAGLERTIAVMHLHTEQPFPDDARAVYRDMYAVHAADTFDASYTIRHNIERDPREWGGPFDEHAKLNVNRAQDRGLLFMLEDMSMRFDLLDAINDWIDEDDEVSSLGVERDYYLSLRSPYLPRNGPLRTLGEFELIAGIWPRDFRGEDWNLNNRLDSNEDDGGRSLPQDEPDGVLDGMWSSRLTVYSTEGGPTSSGLPRIYLAKTTPEELVERLGVTEAQAQALIQFGGSGDADLGDLLITSLGSSSSSGSSGGSSGQNTGNQAGGNRTGGAATRGQSSTVPQLSDDQLRLVLAECTASDPLDRKPGKMNINTVPPEMIRDMFRFSNMDEAYADELIYMRDSRPEGIVSLVDLKEIPKITPDVLQAITRRFDTVSSVFTVVSRGRAAASGLEVEIIAVVDRSTIPVRILEYREQ